MKYLLLAGLVFCAPLMAQESEPLTDQQFAVIYEQSRKLASQILPESDIKGSVAEMTVIFEKTRLEKEDPAFFSTPIYPAVLAQRVKEILDKRKKLKDLTDNVVSKTVPYRSQKTQSTTTEGVDQNAVLDELEETSQAIRRQNAIMIQRARQEQERIKDLEYEMHKLKREQEWQDMQQERKGWR